MKPGSAAACERSITSARAGGVPPGVTLTMRSPSTTINALEMGLSLLPSINSPTRMAMVLAGAAAGAELCAASFTVKQTAARQAAAKQTAGKIRASRVIFRRWPTVVSPFCRFRMPVRVPGNASWLSRRGAHLRFLSEPLIHQFEAFVQGINLAAVTQAEVAFHSRLVAGNNEQALVHAKFFSHFARFPRSGVAKPGDSAGQRGNVGQQRRMFGAPIANDRVLAVQDSASASEDALAARGLKSQRREPISKHGGSHACVVLVGPKFFGAVRTGNDPAGAKAGKSERFGEATIAEQAVVAAPEAWGDFTS